MPPKKSTNIKSRLKILEQKFFLHGAAGREETFHNEMPDSEFDLWPHLNPSAKLMANCGFYFAPTKKLKDRVCCIGCNQLQQSWAGVEDPTEYHLKKHPDCTFSLMQYYISRRESEAIDWSAVPIFRNPLSEEATAVRASTFGTSWPFDKIRGARPTSDTMIAAGFCSFPNDKNDDLASCMYCGTCLEGWELDDDPMVEHTKRADGRGCYFLKMLGSENRKRLSEDEVALRPKKTKFSDVQPTEPIADANAKKGKTKKTQKSKKPVDTVPDQIEESLPPSRPRRAVREAAQKIIDISFGDEGSSKAEHDESFGLTSNEEQLSSEPEPYQSSQRTSKVAGSHKTSGKSDAPKAPKSVSASPLKKSKILDSSFEAGEEDIFSARTLDQGIMESLPVARTLQKKKEPKAKSTPLKDVTNISDASLVISPKKRGRVIVQESDDEEDIILVSNNSSSAHQKENASTSSVNNTEKKESSSTLKPESAAEQNQELVDSPPSEKDPKYSSHSDENSMSEAEPSPLASKCQSPSLKSENSGSLSRLKLTKTTSNKSLLSQTRFFESPKIKRSGSPFLDENHRGSDKIGSPYPIIGPEDNPIEESTDHNIAASLSQLDKRIDDKNQQIEKTQPVYDEETNDGMLEDAPDLSNTAEEAQDESFHSAGETTPDEYWLSTDTNKVFQHLEDLETARTYLSELKTLDYELHDDIDGRITTFINQMPEDELQMTIEEWIQHMAKQGKLHLEQVCNKMIDDFDTECDRAMEKLKSLPTIG